MGWVHRCRCRDVRPGSMWNCYVPVYLGRKGSALLSSRGFLHVTFTWTWLIGSELAWTPGGGDSCSHLGHLTGAKHIAHGLGAEQEHGCTGGLLTQLPYHLHQHLCEGGRLVTPQLPRLLATAHPYPHGSGGPSGCTYREGLSRDRVHNQGCPWVPFEQLLGFLCSLWRAGWTEVGSGLWRGTLTIGSSPVVKVEGSKERCRPLAQAGQPLQGPASALSSQLQPQTGC